MSINADPGTSRYITLTQQIPRLSREEEQGLLEQWREHKNHRAAERLLNAHLRDVVFVALKNRYYGVPIGELIAEGNLGLLRALDKFDPSHGTRFGTYAAYWIRAYIVTCALRSWSLVGSSSGVMRTKLFFKLRRERVRVHNLYGEGAEADEVLAERLGVSRGQLEAMLGRLDGRDVSLDARAYGDGPSLLDGLVDDQDQEAELARDQVRARLGECLEDALDTLDERERFIVKSRFMADADDELSLADIGRTFGVSRERARQLETRAKLKLRKTITDRYGEEVAAEFAVA